MEFRFIVPAEDFGNPVPYLRTTQGSKWSKKYQRYVAWKDWVEAHFIEQIGEMPCQVFRINQKYHVKTMMFFKNNAHADPDNVQKGIKDAIFSKPLNDKYCSGEYYFDYDPKNARVEIEIKEVKS